MDDNYLVIKNPDAKFREELIRRIKANGGYCPSRYERTPETKCHCAEYRKNCNCICGLFIKVPCYLIGE